MPGFRIERVIAAPPERVFTVLTDLGNLPTVVKGIESIEIVEGDGVAVGTRFRETRRMFGREATEEMEVLALEPPSLFILGCENHGCRYHTEHRLTPVETGTRLEIEFEATPLTTISKILAFLTRPLLKACRKEVEKDLADIQVACEGS